MSAAPSGKGAERAGTTQVSCDTSAMTGPCKFRSTISRSSRGIKGQGRMKELLWRPVCPMRVAVQVTERLIDQQYSASDILSKLEFFHSFPNGGLEGGHKNG